MSRKSKAVRELFLAFQRIESSTEYIFFEIQDELVGAETTNVPKERRKVTLKNRNGTRVTLQEDIALQRFHLFWLVPNLKDSKQVLFPYTKVEWEDLWEDLIVKTREASKFIPLAPLRMLEAPNEEGTDRLILQILQDTIPTQRPSVL
ncbi:hypothetical protein BC939DRAFT_466243 [Gamsiella multidivaricata]|uniref:uncharacterized protein n=1 Tax=Gamsiella multidivaricata TaxID=101098 RepID=UPI00221EFE42|nr:uncharacterized protein BC939DRAFT_466243 [Gamsiella multidivaricata]KAI7817376.1 hypothetical protein BC939DRAFT_466243 [Gamsiella multidivaricata]